MKSRTLLYTAILASGLSLAAAGISAGVNTSPTLMSPADFSRLSNQIDLQARLALARCRDAARGERELCRAAAHAEQRVQMADLHSSYYGTVAAMTEARAMKAEAGLDLAGVVCSSRSSGDRAQCLRAARADHARILADG